MTDHASAFAPRESVETEGAPISVQKVSRDEVTALLQKGLEAAAKSENLCNGLRTPVQVARKSALKILLSHYLAARHLEGCWLWAPRDRNGYGVIRLRFFRFAVHVLSYEHFIGPVPAGKEVLHGCDRRACWNPAHLSAGTHRENMQDMARKGRGRKSQHAKGATDSKRGPSIEGVAIRTRSDSAE